MNATQPKWALLLFELPSSLSNLRVKMWRRLQKIGALNLKNGAYVLPSNADTEEDFAWLSQTILDGGGQAMIMHAHTLSSHDHQEIIRQFQELRSGDYKELLENLTGVQVKIKSKSKGLSSETLRELGEIFRGHQERLSEIQKTDFFPTRQVEDVQKVVEAVTRELKSRSGSQSAKVKTPSKLERKAFLGKTWVTRKGMHVDRLASAWLIRTFIDPKARFKFVEDKSAKAIAAPGIPFDMADAEFGHHGEDCSFETLIKSFGLTRDSGLNSLAEIVHDIDIKDGKFGRLEAPGIDLFVKSLRNECKSDAKLLIEGRRFFSSLYGGLKSS